MQALEPQRGLADLGPERAVGCGQRDRREHHVSAARQEFEAASRGRLVFRLGQDAAADRDHRVAREDEAVIASDCMRLLASHAQRVILRTLGVVRGLVDIGGHHAIGRHADPRQQVQPAGGGGSRA